MSQKSAKKIKSTILDQYYKNVYQDFLFGGGAQGLGISYFERQIEKFWVKPKPKRVLEIGGGSGEHLPFLGYVPLEKYISLDLRPTLTKQHIRQVSTDLAQKVTFVEGNAEDLPFQDCTFDRVFTTCLLHHVDDVLAVLLEARRVAEIGGEIAFIFPTDPGILNQVVKKLVSFRKIKKLTQIRPQLFYALEHKNHVLGIMELIRFVFQADELEFKYRPFRFASWNFNLLVVAKIVKR